MMEVVCYKWKPLELWGNWVCFRTTLNHQFHENILLQLKQANLRDLIVATGLAILIKLDSNLWLFILYDLEIRWITSKNNRAPLLGHMKLCALFQSHQWIQTGVTVQICSIQVKTGKFLPRVTLKFYRWPWKTTGHFFYATSSFLHHFIAISQSS